MRLDDFSSWPPDIIQYLEQRHELLFRWHERSYASKALPPVSGPELDEAIRGLAVLLRSRTLHGYHCTRLTEPEIDHILAHGMQPPNLERLHARIAAVRDTSPIDAGTFERLRAENGAAETNRAGMIWFCFYAPRKAGQRASERLFRNWGGEALYGYHETDPLIGPLLQSIGTPCLIEADVPIATFGPGLAFKVVRRFLIDRGLQTREPVEHDDNAKQAIPPSNIRRIIKFPEPDFLELTGCADWTPPLGDPYLSDGKSK
jgi:hypothetical protein